ncbi:alpha-tubulin n-acetyltransferase [Cystoisospora suis]|uniref:Alpha-tubulin n-acetyltransferase n=1 Tax=Cystoisospora suis TaxID=483139 RepID=A0A2C6KFS5_9APIC|nr:alpha-tubulin n-acetyltransferase [Cystoisospora suis]
MEVPFEFLYCRPCVLPPLDPSGSQGLYSFPPSSCHSSDPHSHSYPDRSRAVGDPPLPPSHSLSSSQSGVCTGTQRASVSSDSIVKVPLRSCAATFVFERPLLLQIGAYSGCSTSHTRPASTTSGRSFSRQNSHANLCPPLRQASSFSTSSSTVSGGVSNVSTPFCPRAYVFVEKLSSPSSELHASSRHSQRTLSNCPEPEALSHSSSIPPEREANAACPSKGDHHGAKLIPKESKDQGVFSTMDETAPEGQWMQTGSHSVEILRFLRENLDILGSKSATAQGIRQPMTSLVKLETLQSRPGPRMIRTGSRGGGVGGDMTPQGDGNVRLYVRVQRGLVRGFLKVGKKVLWVGTKTGMEQTNAFSLLDFYVFESCQREGHGGALFRRMLNTERISPCHIAYDRPSPKLLQFLAKNYGLRNHVPQANNFVLFDEYFLPAPPSSSRMHSRLQSSLRRGQEQTERGVTGCRNIRNFRSTTQAPGLKGDEVSQNSLVDCSPSSYKRAGRDTRMFGNGSLRCQAFNSFTGDREENAALARAGGVDSWPCSYNSGRSLGYLSGEPDTRGRKELSRKREWGEARGGVGEFSPVLSSSVTDVLWSGRSASFHRQLPTMVQAASGSCSGVQTPVPCSSGSSRQTSAASARTAGSRNASARLSATKKSQSTDLPNRLQVPSYARDSTHVDGSRRDDNKEEGVRTSTITTANNNNDNNNRLLRPSAADSEGPVLEKSELRQTSTYAKSTGALAAPLYPARGKDLYFPDSRNTHLGDRHLVSTNQGYTPSGMTSWERRSFNEGSSVDYPLDIAPSERSHMGSRDPTSNSSRAYRHSNSCSSTTSTMLSEDVRHRGGAPLPSSSSECLSYDRGLISSKDDNRNSNSNNATKEKPSFLTSLGREQNSPAAAFRVAEDDREKSWKRHPLEAGWRDYENFAHSRRGNNADGPWHRTGGYGSYAEGRLEKKSPRYEGTPGSRTGTEGTVLSSKYANRLSDNDKGPKNEGEESRSREETYFTLGGGSGGGVGGSRNNRGPTRGVYEQLHHSQVATLLQWQ